MPIWLFVSALIALPVACLFALVRLWKKEPPANVILMWLKGAAILLIVGVLCIWYGFAKAMFPKFMHVIH